MTKSNDNIVKVNFKELRFRKLAVQFVDMWEKDGKKEAGLWAVETLPDKLDHIYLSAYVRDEFEDRGYEFNDPE